MAGASRTPKLNGFYPLRERIKLIAHVGVLHGLRGPLANARDRIDLRLAIGFDAGDCNVQLAWLGGASVGPGTAQARAGAARAGHQRLVFVLIDQFFRHF